MWVVPNINETRTDKNLIKLDNLPTFPPSNIQEENPSGKYLTI